MRDNKGKYCGAIVDCLFVSLEVSFLFWMRTGRWAMVMMRWILARSSGDHTKKVGFVANSFLDTRGLQVLQTWDFYIQGEAIDELFRSILRLGPTLIQRHDSGLQLLRIGIAENE